jgi:hypothetical protein
MGLKITGFLILSIVWYLLCFLEYQTMDKVQNPVILSVVHLSHHSTS